MKLGKAFDDLEDITNRAVYLLARIVEIPPDLIGDEDVLDVVEEAQRIISDWVQFQQEMWSGLNSDHRYPPGAVIADHADEKGLTLEELYDKLGFEREYTRQLLEGHAAIDESAAQRLSELFGEPVEFWLNLEDNYWNWKIHKEKDSIG